MCVLFTSMNLLGQVSAYSKSITSGTYTNHGGTVLLTNADDADAAASNIGFNFVYAGTTYTQFVANSNGYITLGGTGQGIWYTPLSSINNVIAAVARDGKATGDVRVQVQGVAPNRVCNIQYTNFDLLYTATTRRVSFQIQLFETSNNIDIIYTGAIGTTTTSTVQVGLRGASAADFNNYQGSNANWAALAAGTANTQTVSWGSSQNATRSMPSNGRILRWTAPVISACTGTPTPGNTLSSSPTAAPGGTVNLSLQNATSGTGVTYQWQSAPTSGGTWTNIGGATAATYTATVTANTWYRCLVTCAGNTGTSTASQVSLAYCAASGTGASSYISNFVTSGGVTNISNASGFTAGGYANYSPTVSCSQAAGLSVNFTLNYLSDPGTKIFIDWNNDLDFNDAGENVYSSNAYVVSTVAGTITVPVGQAVGNYRMRIVVDWNSTVPIACPVSINGETEDYTFTVSAPPSCIAPTALTSSAITSTSATLSWTAASPAPASGYQYFYSTVNTAPTGATIPSGSTAAGVTTANISGLTANTTYYFWVRSNCGGSGTSAWAGAGSFFTGYCIPTITTIGDYISAFSTTGGFTNVSTSGTSTAAYENYTAQAVSQSAGSAVNFNGSYVGGFAGFSIWVDWNNNLVFDAAELMYNAPATAATWTGSFTVPVGQAVGNYRMRIRAAWNALSPPACGNTSYGQTEDYTFTVTTPPACATPSALVGTITSTTDATLTWTAPASAPASGYNYFYSTVNTAPTGSTIPSGSTAAGVTTASISALTPNTTYYFWVQSNCGGTGTSAWAGSSSFVTSFVIPASGNNSYTMCSGNLYDNGGSAGDYQNNWNGYTVLYPSTPGASISISGTTAGESCCDYVNVYNGVGTGSLIGTYYMGTAIPSIVSTAANGALTILFFSDVSVTGAGVNITVACVSPCSGTPTPGATTATTTQVFAAGSTTLGIANIQPTGTTYQWQSGASASGPWTNIGGATAATYVASPTTATYYQCIVTCAAASASANSTPIMISVNPYCEPVYTTGKTDGDLISNISIAGTTLSNNSGTAQTNPSYTFFSGQPNYTCDLVAANSYTVNVTVGTWGTQGIAAWIDYNDNNIFEATELIGSTATTIGTGTGGTPIPANHTASFTINLSCTPPLGTHRMRVRDVYNLNGPLIDPCAVYTWGETEDYMVNVISGPAFTPAFATTQAATSCVGTTVNYVATAGQTNYAWTWAGTAGTDYTVVSGGTSTSNTASVTWITGGAHSMTMNYASPLGCASSGAVSNTVTMPTAGSSLAQNNENATCVVNQNGWVHFYHSSGRLIASVNSQGQNLGNVTATSYVEGAPVSVDACTNSNPIYTTSVMGRHWVITPTIQPTTAVLVRLPYANTEFSDLTSAASTNANSNDDLLTPADLGLSKYSNGTNTNVNNVATDNCGVGATTFHTQSGNGASTAYSSVNASYADFSIPGFSEFWLHGSAQASPLPVELVSFQANCAGEGKVNVTWATASEHNSANFTIEKSRDGMNWTVMASLAGAGNSTQMINYSTVDNNAAAGVNYYRLTQTDFDGASETFNIASANCGDNSPLTTVKVYPNPSAGDFYVDFNSEEIIGSSVISITDARGMEVYKMNVTVEKGSNVFHIENMEAAPGIYYIQVSNGTATSTIVKHSLR